MPLSRPQLPPTEIIVPGPGPSEPRLNLEASEVEPALVAFQPHMATKPVLPIPPSLATDATGSDRDDSEVGPAVSTDPYSNLESAFGNYLQDEPRPITTGGARDDLLF